MRPPFRQIFHATVTYVLHFAKSSTQLPHASSISPNLRSKCHTRPPFRQIFEATATRVLHFAKSSKQLPHASFNCPFSIPPRFQLAVDIFQLPVEKDSGRSALLYRKSFGIVFGCG